MQIDSMWITPNQSNLPVPQAGLGSGQAFVPGGRVELPRLTTRDFESRMTTNSITPAIHTLYTKNT